MPRPVISKTFERKPAEKAEIGRITPTAYPVQPAREVAAPVDDGRLTQIPE